MWNKIIAFFMSVIAFIASILGLGQLVAEKDFTSFEDTSYGPHERNVLDLYLPKDTAETGLILFIHGGAWVAGDKSSYTSAAKDWCNQYSVAAATINYRYLSPDVTMADITDDIDAAVSKIKELAEENGIKIGKMLLTGHSAGGHLSMLYAYSKADTAAITPAAVANYCGPTDLNDPNFFINNDLGTDNVLMLLSYSTGIDITQENIDEYRDEIAAFSPITYVDENTVPTIINHGMTDTVVPYSNAVSLDEKMTQYGVNHVFNTYPDSGHGLDNNKDNEDYAYALAVEYMREYVLK